MLDNNNEMGEEKLIDEHWTNDPDIFNNRDYDDNEFCIISHERGEKSYARIVDGKRVGRCVQYWDNLETTRQRTDANGELGPKEKYKERKILAEGNYINGLKEGQWIEYEDYGRRSEAIKLKEERVDGLIIAPYRGHISSIYHFKNDEYNGPYLNLYRSGVTELHGNYIDGLRVGEWRYNNHDGSLYMKEVYDAGHLIKTTSYDSKGNLTGEYNTDNDNTFVERYFPEGTIKMKGILEGGKRKGEWLFYNVNGELSNSRVYNLGHIDEDFEPNLVNAHDLMNSITGSYYLRLPWEKDFSVLHFQEGGQLHCFGVADYRIISSAAAGSSLDFISDHPRGAYEIVGNSIAIELKNHSIFNQGDSKTSHYYGFVKSKNLLTLKCSDGRYTGFKDWKLFEPE